MVNETVVSQHAEEAAFLWTLRNRAVGEPHYSLDDLAALDERVEAHLDGLTIAGDVGWKFCRENLANEGPGEVFALAVLAFGAGDRARMLEALQAGCASPLVTPGLISALGWLEDTSVSPWIAKLLEARSASHRAVGIAASAIHRTDPGPALTAAVQDDDPTLRARALRAVGELRRHDLAGHLRGRVADADDSCRFWATWSLALNGHRDAVALLTTWFERNDAFSDRALHVALRAMALDESRGWISTLARDPRLIRLAVIGAGIVGDPASVPWLIRRMDTPALARLAGEAFSMITGADLSYEDLDQDEPLAAGRDEETSIDKVLALDYESNLRWPASRRVAEWWERNHQRFGEGTRYLAGEPLAAESALHVLKVGKQRQRAAAALELALLNRDRALFEMRARAVEQCKRLSVWNS